MTPTDWIKLMARYLLLAASGLGMLWLIWHQGYERGAGDVRLEVANQKNREAGDALNQFIAGARQLTAEANQASNALAAQVAARQTADEQSTRELKNALKKTASQRVKCMFDDDVMQLLREARQLAATAATDGLSSRNDREVPATGGSGR
ncbi:hypothetical protein CFY86_29040 [Raoultella ornithinolytica]|uniref:DUF2570 domain-containing protein n=1 Tax=Raoultella ornithinolytica TaxID=54291 RepID=A0A855F0H2_RAOOR|nr:hypothetical protein [Raoultella ornithinolytica]MBE8771848.1 hypothetical protein [Klebsiella quasipneumoniae]QJK23432.1 hypothetical protein HJX28_15900 [Klebsiella pneumoniae]PIK80772.1 hypothetical protein CFY86_29040 [Raoultella ornithinolytica]HBS9329744.1 hypothetical protein [Klebsiella pneumoniae]HBS9341666.1 hypothetical protein [Klebsiella pneumoniae]